MFPSKAVLSKYILTCRNTSSRQLLFHPRTGPRYLQLDLTMLGYNILYWRIVAIELSPKHLKNIFGSSLFCLMLYFENTWSKLSSNNFPITQYDLLFWALRVVHRSSTKDVLEILRMVPSTKDLADSWAGIRIYVYTYTRIYVYKYIRIYVCTYIFSARFRLDRSSHSRS